MKQDIKIERIHKETTFTVITTEKEYSSYTR